MITLLVGFVLGASVAFHAGFYGRELLEAVRRLKPSERAPEPFVSIGTATKGQNLEQRVSQVVTPLPPSVIRQREEEELRKLRYQ